MHYRDLDVFKKAYVLALDIHRVSCHFPKEELYGGMADQMRRASKSICANIGEGLGKGGSKVEQARFLRMAMGSCEEISVWNLFCKDLDYISVPKHLEWDNECEQIGKMLFNLIERRLNPPKKDK